MRRMVRPEPAATVSGEVADALYSRITVAPFTSVKFT